MKPGILQRVRDAIRANLLPGVFLQLLIAVFLLAYLTHDGTRSLLAGVADLKSRSGLAFAFLSYVVSAAVLPELLQIAIFQRGRARWENMRNFLTAAPAWGGMGVIVDIFYAAQATWFGPGDAWHILLVKVLVDQFVFSPLVGNPYLTIYFHWRNSGFRLGALREAMRLRFVVETMLPVQAAAWVIWIPGVTLVYFMPSTLQLPVAVLIQAFWVLVFSTIQRPQTTVPA